MSFYCLTHFLFEMLVDAAAEFPAEIILLTLLQKSVKVFGVLDTSKATSISLFSLFCLSSYRREVERLPFVLSHKYLICPP